MRKSTAVVVAFVVAAVLAPMASQANHAGCYVIGEVQGLDTLRTCTYEARTESQLVLVGTPYEWRIWVLRYDDNNQPHTVTLATGIGPVLGAPPEVHPEIGETVHVTMSFGCTPPYCGTIGFLAAGLEQNHP